MFVLIYPAFFKFPPSLGQRETCRILLVRGVRNVINCQADTCINFESVPGYLLKIYIPSEHLTDDGR